MKPNQETHEAKDMAKSVYVKPIYFKYLSRTDERDILERKLRELIPLWCTKDQMSILEPGCAVGSAAARLTKILDEKGVSCNYVALDPSKEQLERFQKSLPHLNAELVCSRFEDYNPNKKFDLAYAVHSLYYMDSLKEAVKKLYGLADKSIIVHYGSRGIHEIRERFSSSVKGGPNINSTYHDVVRAIEELGIKYHLYQRVSHFDIGDCKILNQDGRDLIKFFLEDPNPSEETIGSVSDFIREGPDRRPHDIALILVG
ncbi:MAG: class I SAM-dependent methyltransferase [Candidatus Woesearchaeota archaeon]